MIRVSDIQTDARASSDNDPHNNPSTTQTYVPPTLTIPKWYKSPNVQPQKLVEENSRQIVHSEEEISSGGSAQKIKKWISGVEGKYREVEMGDLWEGSIEVTRGPLDLEEINEHTIKKEGVNGL